MSSDILTSAPRPAPLSPPIAPRARGPEGDARAVLDALARLVRGQAGSLRAMASAQAEWLAQVSSQLPRDHARGADELDAAPVRRGGGGAGWRGAVEALARTVILALASARPLRALEASIDRRIAADEASQQAAHAAASAHVLRVRSRLTESEQRLLDELLRDRSLEEVLAMIVRRGEDEALEVLRSQLGSMEPVVSAASLARQIGGVRGLLTNEEYDRLIMRLPHLSEEEQGALHAHLRAMTPSDAAMVLRSYLRPLRALSGEPRSSAPPA